MKTALICMLQLHKNSGSARTAFENIRYFKNKGYEVHVAAMTLDKKSIMAEGAIPHKMLPWLKSTGMWRRRWYNWQVQNLRKKLKPTITLGHGDLQEQDVVTLHNCVFLASELILGKPLAADHEMAITHGSLLKNKGFKKLIANSNLMKEDCIKRFGISAHDIHVVYPALDTRAFSPEKREKITPKVNVALVTSGNFKKRGLDLFLEAINSLPEGVRARASFRVLGKDSSVDSPFLTFDPPRSDVENYYRSIDVFVLPARIEEFGRVVLEAMGCGLPVITTDKVGAAELLEGESRNFIIPSHDGKALAQVLEQTIVDQGLRERLGKLNAETALKHSEELVYEKFDAVFDSLMSKR
jgi:UDP-glucose:(heptosyl)LPS alpha-1,3-glucosyltransferase